MRPLLVWSGLVWSAYLVAADPGKASADSVSEFGLSSLTTLVSKATDAFDSDAAQVKTVGASWVRLVVAWNLVEPSQGQFDWSTVDPAVLASRANGAKMLLLLTGPAPVERLLVAAAGQGVAVATSEPGSAFNLDRR